MLEKPKTRCRGCSAPVVFQPGAGSRLCPFCGTVNLVREQRLAVPLLELKTDEVFQRFQQGDIAGALADAERMLGGESTNVRLAFYRAVLLFELKRTQDAIYALIDLSGLDAPVPLRADMHAKLAEALLAAGRVEEALESALKCDRLLPSHPVGRLMRARILEKLGRRGEAITFLKELLANLDKGWKITFPFPRAQVLMALGALLRAEGHHDEAATAFEEVLLRQTSAPLPTVAGAVLGLSEILMDPRRDHQGALALLRHGVLLDPENRLGLMDGLRKATDKAGEDVRTELTTFTQTREELLREIREAISKHVASLQATPNLLQPGLELSQLANDPDQRTDILEGAALRLSLRRFDRGTLYPLPTLEDYRRWVAAWRLREAHERTIAQQQQARRVEALKSAHQTPSGMPRADPLAALDGRRRRSLGRWLLLGLVGGLLLVGIFLGWLGDRFLDEFQGRLIKIECLGENQSPPCSLMVAGGPAAIERHRNRATSSGLRQILSDWLDSRIQSDGTIAYPMGFPWGHLSMETYSRCVGKPIAKLRFTFAPLCSTP